MDKPIGYWLKHLHDLLERQLDATLADFGVGRRHWQVLNTLSRGETARGDLYRHLSPFWTDGGPDLGRVLDDLSARGWTRPGETDDALALDPSGRAAHARIADRVQSTRETVLRGLTPEQYTETVRVLSVMAANVEAALER